MRRLIADLITDLEVFKKEYDQHGSKFLATKYGVTMPAINGFARRNGFAHTPKRAKELQKKNRKDIVLGKK